MDHSCRIKGVKETYNCSLLNVLGRICMDHLDYHSVTIRITKKVFLFRNISFKMCEVLLKQARCHNVQDHKFQNICGVCRHPTTR